MTAVASRAPKGVAPSKIERGLAAVEGDERLGDEGRPHRLSRSPRRRRVHEAGAVADDACEKVEPVDAEVPKNEIVDRLESGACDPAVVPADLDMDAGHVADEAGADGFTDIGEMGRPAAVLVDREPEPLGFRQRDERLPDREVFDERLLR